MAPGLLMFSLPPPALLPPIEAAALDRPPFWPPQMADWRSVAPRPPAGKVRYICPITGMRFYSVPDGRDRILAVPGVTSILSNDAPKEEGERLAAWREREIAAGRDPDAGRIRGSAVHKILEDHVRGDRTLIKTKEPDEIIAYASGMESALKRYESFLWSERPLINGWDHVWSHRDDKGERLARLWNTTWGFAGTPDLIAKRNKKICLGDFKSSTRPYFRPSGGPVPAYQKVPYLKYIKTVKQLCAYALAAEETLGIEIDELEIYVCLPGKSEIQHFIVTPLERARETENFKIACAKFWQQRLLLSQSAEAQAA